MRRTPTAEQFLEALGGRIYRPVGVNVVRDAGTGWSGSGETVGSLSLQYLLGKSMESVVVESSVTAREHRPLEALQHRALQHLVFEIALNRRPKFPITLDRKAVEIAVEGRPRSFTAYSAGSDTVAIAEIDGVSVMIRCRANRLAKLSLERLAVEELRRAIKH